jgi:hypothetical protein
VTAKHECRFDWCTNGNGSPTGMLGVDFEHMSDVYSVPATADIRVGADEVPQVDVSLWYQEDLKLAPDIHLSIGDHAVDLKIEEAVLLVDNLQRLIFAVIRGTNVEPERILDYHGRGGAQ